jgi:hypothetical protein
MKRKNIKLISVTSFVTLILIAIGYVIFVRIGADQLVVVSNPASYVSSQAKVNYQDDEGGIYSEQSNVLRLQKVSLFGVSVSLQGKTDKMADSKATVSFFDTDLSGNQNVGSLDISYDSNTGTWPKPDWTTLTVLDPEKTYDIQVSSPGYLAKRVVDQRLGDVAELVASSLLAGDVNGDGVINWYDFSDWKVQYGQAVPAGSAFDFNGDGFVNYFDYAIAYGSDNWQKTVGNQ